MPYKDPEKQRAYQRKWMRERREENKKWQRNYRKKLKKKVFSLLGDKCVYCSCDNLEALEINHKKGGGNKEFGRFSRTDKRTKYKCHKSFYLDIIAGRRFVDDLELTCRICNSWHYLKKIKRIEGNWEIKWIPSQDLNVSTI